MDKLLTIAIPTYNMQDYLRKCLDSLIIREDLMASVEVLVVNDGSRDDSSAIAHVEVITQDNRGLSGARNTALLDIDAAYVTFVDSDDLLAPGALEAWMEKATALDADIVEGGFERFDAHGTISLSPQIDSDDNRSLSGFAWGKVYKAELFEHVHFPEGYWFEDSVCCAVIFPGASQIATAPGVMYRWRRNDSSITSLSKASPRCIESFWVMKQLIEDREALGLAMTAEVAYYFLWQVQVNYRRVARLYDPEIDRSLYAETCTLFDSHFRPEDFSSLDSPVAEALFKGDYAGYVLACALL